MTRSLPQAMIIDLDDTILMYSGVGDEVSEVLCAQFAADVEDVTAEMLYDAIDVARRWFWDDPGRHEWGRWNPVAARRTIVERAFAGINLPFDQRATALADTFTERREAAVRPFPDAIETLGRLRELGVRLGLLTNGIGDTQRAKIDRFDLAGCFDAILVEGEFGVGKPDERVYRHLLGELGSSPEEAWCVGDNLEWEVATPQRLGIYGVWCDHRGEGLPEDCQIRPDRIVRRISELI